MTVIYGLRRTGDNEFRYIGRSGLPLGQRLHKHKLNARRGYPLKISAWIRSEPDVEIVPLEECAPEGAAFAERAAVERYQALGHRLTNGHLLSPTIAKARQTGAAA